MASESSDPRMTLTTQLVLRALLDHPADELYGLEICAKAGLPSGTIHPILARLEKIAWLESRWEEADPREQGRPRRRYYRLSPDGAERARVALARVTESTAALRRLRPGLASGGTA
jgi:PadR family transcriptional regulator, regulatory protein PadR